MKEGRPKEKRKNIMCDSIYTKLQKILANLQREEDQQMVGGLDEKGHGKFGGRGVCVEMEMFARSWFHGYLYVKTDRIVHFKYVRFSKLPFTSIKLGKIFKK